MQNKCASTFKVWEPLNLFRCPADYNHAVVVLNRPIRLDYKTVFSLWEKSKITVTVDGGTNRWMHYIGEERAEILLRGECKDYLPTLVTGDMDSIDPKLMQKLEKLDTNVCSTLNQNQTDFTKALMELQRYAAENNIRLNGVYVLVETSGRFDHIIANINTLYKAKNIIGTDTEVILVSTDSLTWLLEPGRHKILIPDVLIRNRCWCALVPFGTSTSQVSTTGLRWNLSNTTMKFGDLVSTSNTYDGYPEVTVTTSERIIWSMSIEPFTLSCKSS